MPDLDQNIKDLLHKPMAIVLNDVLEAKTDPKTNEQLTELIKAYGADSDIVKPLADLKAAKDDDVRDELMQLLSESGKKQLPLMPLDRDHAAMLAARFGITNREVGSWRRRHVQEMASKGQITDVDIEREVYIEGMALDQLTARLIKGGQLVRDGEGYKLPEPAMAS
jgi:hypothetical protein